MRNVRSVEKRLVGRVCRALDLGLNVLVAGSANDLTDLGGVDAARAEARDAATVGELLTRVGTALEVDLSETDEPYDQIALLTKTLTERPGRPVVLVDHPPRDVALKLFARLRDEVWQIPLTWVVVVDIADAVVLDRPPSDAFFDVTVAEDPRENGRPIPAEVLRLVLT